MLDHKEDLMRKLSGAQFAAQEMRLYLDTHNWDEQAFKSHQEYCKMAKEYQDKYEKMYGPITCCDMYGETAAQWTNAPWPWENEKEVKI